MFSMLVCRKAARRDSHIFEHYLKNINKLDLFSWAPKSLQTVAAAMKLKMLAPWKESYDKLSILKRHHLSTKVHRVKAMASPVVTYRCESWTIKKAEH